MNLKRDNWTNQEVINMVKGSRLVTVQETDNDWVKGYNTALECVLGTFSDLSANPETSYSATALNTEDGMLYNVSALRLPR